MFDVSDQEFTRVIARNITIAGVLRDLGRATVGTNYKLVHRDVARLMLDTSHWKGKGHSPGKQPSKVPWSDVLVTNSPYLLNNRRKKALLREKLLDNCCALCGIGPEWQAKPLVLRLDHINGIRDDNRLENLRMLCPNCDSQTDTYCGRNKARQVPNTCACDQMLESHGLGGRRTPRISFGSRQRYHLESLVSPDGGWYSLRVKGRS